MEEIDELRRERQRAVVGLPDAELRQEAAEFASWNWSRRSRLAAHADKHGPALGRLLGREPPDPDAFLALQQSICREPHRVFTSLTARRQVEYHFVREVGEGRAMIVTSRDGYIRTLLDTMSLAGWLSRRAAVEVTDRVVEHQSPGSS